MVTLSLVTAPVAFVPLTVMPLAPTERAMPLIVHVAPAVAVPDAPVRSFVQLTSPAKFAPVPLTLVLLTELSTETLPLGSVMLKDGGGACRVIVTLSLVAVPDAFVPVTVMSLAPTERAMPLIVHVAPAVAVPDAPVRSFVQLTSPARFTPVPLILVLVTLLSTVTLPLGSVMLTVGAPAACRVIVTLSLVAVPDVFVPVTVMSLAPTESAMPLIVHVAPAVAVPDAPVRSFVQLTSPARFTPVPLMLVLVTELSTVTLSLAGLVMVTDGASVAKLISV